MFSFLLLPRLAPNKPLPRAIFDGICDVLCTSSTLQKRAVFWPLGAGRRHMAPPPIAKAKATPHAMRSNMPGIRCLVHRRIQGLTPDSRAPAEGVLCSPRLAVCSPKLADVSRMLQPYVGPMFAYVSRMWPQVGPMLALCWPKLAVCWPYLAPMLALSWPYVTPSCRQIWPNHVQTPSTCHFFLSGTRPEPENHVKRIVFW